SARVAVHHLARSRMVRAAPALAGRLERAKPRCPITASSGAQQAQSEEESGQEDQPRAGVERHREEVDSWSESVSGAHEAALEQQRRAEAEEAEAQRRAEEEAAEEARRQQAAEEAAPEPEEEAPQSEQDTPATEEPPPPAPAPGLEESLSTPAEPQVEFTGDLNTYLQDLAAAYPGSISVSLQELTGQQRSAA